MRSLDFVDKGQQRRDLPPFRVGDTVRVHQRIKEGEKERIQVFEGVVIRRRGAGSSETFTVRKVSYGVGVERILPVQSPNVTKLEIKARGHVRRSRLFYLRELRGKKARLRSKVRDLSDLLAPAEMDERDAVEPVPPASEEEEETRASAAEAAPEAADEAPASEPGAQAAAEEPEKDAS